jgi:hypothetical protein
MRASYYKVRHESTLSQKRWGSVPFQREGSLFFRVGLASKLNSLKTEPVFIGFNRKALSRVEESLFYRVLKKIFFLRYLRNSELQLEVPTPVENTRTVYEYI